jgi:hypothetical protein
MADNDVIKLNAILKDMNDKISALVELGQDGFKAPVVITPDELTEMVGKPIGPYRPQSNDLLWFYALKITVQARQMLEQSSRIFQQMDDDKFATRAQTIVDTIDEQFNPVETTLQVYGKLLHRNNHGEKRLLTNQ